MRVFLERPVDAVDADPVVRAGIVRRPVGLLGAGGEVVIDKIHEAEARDRVNRVEERCRRRATCSRHREGRIRIGRQPNRLSTSGVRRVAPAIIGDINVKVFGRLEGQRGAKAELVLGAAIFSARDRFLPAFIAVLAANGETGLCLVGQRQVEHAFEIPGVIIADVSRYLRLEFVRRLVGDHVDQACRRVAAEQRALRAFEDFDALDIEDRAGIHEGKGIGDFVNIGADSRCGRQVDRIESDAAQRIGRHALIALRDREAGHDGLQVVDAVHAQCVERVFTKGLDAHRDIVDRFLAALGGHNDGTELERAVCGRRLFGFLRNCRHLRRQRAEGSAQQGITADSGRGFHSISPPGSVLWMGPVQWRGHTEIGATGTSYRK